MEMCMSTIYTYRTSKSEQWFLQENKIKTNQRTLDADEFYLSKSDWNKTK